MIEIYPSVRKYQESYNSDKTGKMGIATKLNWYEPRNPYRELDIDAADRAFQFTAGWFLHPLLVNGDYSETFKVRLSINRNNILLSFSKVSNIIVV